ncbi:hypothetical protein [Saccharothrix sp. ST-888]|uniref:hypothetical protein n=1 Tax=Saccharothrix sp. ST-888 TaxID=1427391 RepID=UPI0007C77E7A|nr:hypothetical protein [Saccharothrix sp. ST-888]
MDESHRPAKGDIFTPPVIVRPPTRGARPYRRVEIYGRLVGKAYGEPDVAEFIRQAGVDDPDLEDPDLIGWRGGDRTTWSAEPKPVTATAPAAEPGIEPESAAEAATQPENEPENEPQREPASGSEGRTEPEPPPVA